MAKLSHAKLDPDHESGLWVPYRGLEFRVLRWSSPSVQARLDELRRRNRSKLEDSEKPAFHECLTDISKQTLGDVGIVDWRNVDDDNGQPLPFTRDAVKVLTVDPNYETLTQHLINSARDDDAYLCRLEEADQEN
jgi:hypothetical protein